MNPNVNESKPSLTKELLQQEARLFAEVESIFPEPSLYGMDMERR